MERNSGDSIPYERNFEEQKEDAGAALCLCSFKLRKVDDETIMELEAKKARDSGKKDQKKKATDCGTGRMKKAKKHGSAEKFQEAGKDIEGCILPELPPVESLNGQIGICSKPFEKQLTKSDLQESQNRLRFNTEDANNFLLPLLNPGEDLVAGIPVIVYDSEGRKHPMTFKVWHGRAYVLIGKWIEFARNHGFQEVTDWITVWMFRHSRSEKLCFVIISRRLPTSEILPKRKRTALPPLKHGGRGRSGDALKKEN